MSYLVYTELYPTDKFYQKMYEQITLSPFPTSGHIIRKDTSYPTFPDGDYEACALVEMSAQDFLRLQQYLARDAQFSLEPCITSASFAYSQSFEKVTHDISCAKYDFGYAQKKGFGLLYIGLLKDGKSVIMYRMRI